MPEIAVRSAILFSGGISPSPSFHDRIGLIFLFCSVCIFHLVSSYPCLRSAQAPYRYMPPRTRSRSVPRHSSTMPTMSSTAARPQAVRKSVLLRFCFLIAARRSLCLRSISASVMGLVCGGILLSCIASPYFTFTSIF